MCIRLFSLLFWRSETFNNLSWKIWAIHTYCIYCILKIIIYKQAHAQKKIHQNSVYQIAISEVKQLINFSLLFCLAQILFIVHVLLLRFKHVSIWLENLIRFSYLSKVKLSFQRDKIKDSDCFWDYTLVTNVFKFSIVNIEFSSYNNLYESVFICSQANTSKIVSAAI